jgi:hypothetical protein
MRRFIFMVSSVLLTFAACTPALGQQAEKAIIADQPDSPVTISSYSNGYGGGGMGPDSRVAHQVELKNTGDQEVVAVDLGFAMTTVFDEFLYVESGVIVDTLSVGGTRTERWTIAGDELKTFHTGIAYVRQVRNADGTVWKADLSPVAKRVQNIVDGFEASQLKPRKERDRSGRR